ncbi:MAG: flagellar hook-length control protein FliK, partial [Pseudomonadota bacterium]
AAQTQEQRPPRAAARAEAADDALVQTNAPQNNTPQVNTLTAQIQTQTPGAANAAVPMNASVQLASNVAVPLSGLAVNIALNAQAGQSRFEIRLDPAELGRIDVRLDVDRNGQVTSHLTVERPATLDLLRRDAPQLQRALEDAGLKTGDSGLQFSLRDQSQQQQRADDDSTQRNSYRLVVDEIPAIPSETARTYARMAAARGGVDIRI